MQGKPLLAPGRAGELNQAGRVVVPIIRGRACLPDLSITGSLSTQNTALVHHFPPVVFMSSPCTPSHAIVSMLLIILHMCE